MRRHAIAAVAAIRPGPKVSVPLFAKLMQDSDPGVQLRVMQTVADAKGAAVPALIEALNNPAAAYWACVILRDIGPDGVGAAPALIERLKDSNPEIRREATLALAALQAKDAVPAIVPLLKDEHAQIAATYALAMLGSMPPDAESTVRANVKSKDEMLSAVSMWALARIHPEDMKLKQAVLSHLVDLLKSKDEYARLAAARGLAALPPSPEIALPIFAKALVGADETTTHYMLDALASMGPAAVPQLIHALDYAPLRPQVAGILGRIGAPAAPATEALAKLLSDPDPNVSIEAAHALADIGPGAKAAVPALVEVLKQPEGGPRYAAVLCSRAYWTRCQGSRPRAAGDHPQFGRLTVAAQRLGDSQDSWSQREIGRRRRARAGRRAKLQISPIPQRRRRNLGTAWSFRQERDRAAPACHQGHRPSRPRGRHESPRRDSNERVLSKQVGLARLVVAAADTSYQLPGSTRPRLPPGLTKNDGRAFGGVAFSRSLTFDCDR